MILLCSSALGGCALVPGHADDARLHRALMQSFPDQPGYDPAAAAAELEALGEQSNEPGAIARARLNDLRARHDCEVQVGTLKERLAKIADIERTTKGH